MKSRDIALTTIVLLLLGFLLPGSALGAGRGTATRPLPQNASKALGNSKHASVLSRVQQVAPGSIISSTSVLTGNSMSGPTGVAVVGSQVWVSNSSTSTISRFTTAGGTAGSPLTGNGLSSPYAIAVVGTQVWVENAGANSISRFNFDGTSAGSAITGNGLNLPKGLAVIGSQVWASNDGDSLVPRFTTSGASAGTALSGNGLNSPRTAALIGTQAWVPDGGTDQISFFTTAGAATGTPLSGNGLSFPECVLAVGTQVWVSNGTGNSISMFNTDESAIGTQTDPSLNNPHQMALVNGNQVWVANQSGNSITVFTTTLATSTPTPTPTKTPTPTPTKTPTPTSTPVPAPPSIVKGNGLNAPSGVAIVSSRVWVANVGNNTISEFTLTGGTAASPLSGNGLNAPYAMAVVGTQVWVVNQGNNTISRFNTDGTSAGAVLTGNGLSAPEGIAVIGSQVWVSNDGNNTISRFTTSGGSAGSALSGNGLARPRNPALIGTQVWVPDGDTSSISLFNTDGTPISGQITGNNMNFPETVLAIGSLVWVDSAQSGSVSVFGTDHSAKGLLTDRGMANAHQMAFDGTYIWIANKDANSLSVIASSASTTTPGPLLGGLAQVKHSFVIMLENQDWSNIQGSPSAPYINGTLLPQSSYATQYYNPGGNHPSLPNYLWLEGGQCWNYCGTDNNPSASPNGIPASSPADAFHDLLNTKGISWREYAEGITDGTCPMTDNGLYAARHNPFVYFNDVNGTSSVCTAHEKSYSDLATDLTNSSVAQYNFITPNLCDDGHDSCAPTSDPIKQTDNWLSTAIPQIMQSQTYLSGGAIFITWDEGVSNDGPIGMIVLSPGAKGGGYNEGVYFTHGSLLRTLQEITNVGPYLGDAQNQVDLSDLFTTP
jgi:DNA-binding beta-propeller fold protein YncE